MGSYVFVYSPGSRCGKLRVCVLPRFKVWVVMYLRTAQVQVMGSCVFVYCPDSKCG